MGLFEKIFKPQYAQPKASEFFQMLNGYTPIFTTFKGQLYESEIVRGAIDARARNIAKLKVEFMGSAKPSLQAKLKHAPNEWQTWYQFMYRLSTILDVENTAIIVPVFDKFGEITGIYPIQASLITLLQLDGRAVLKVQFQTGKTAAVFLDECAVLTKYQYKHDLFGEKNDALTPTMALLQMQNQGILEGVKSAATYRFIAKLSNFSKAEDLAKERQRFNRENLEEGGGILLFPNTYNDIKQVDTKPFVVDSETMALIEKRVDSYFGTNEDIRLNKAYGDKWSAFYEGAVEPFAIQFSEVVSKMLFTLKERSMGNYVMATSNRLQYMTTNEKLNVSAQMADRGILNRDEVREIWNLPPLPNNEGQAYIIRGEYWNATEKINEGENNGQQD